MLKTLLVAACVALTLGAAPPQRAKIKLATLVPEGSVWDKTFRQMGSDWKKETKGRVNLRVYPGGVAGDEPDIIRKMRIGQVQAASLTVTGLSAIEPAFTVFETPFFFESYDELEHVLSAVTPELEKRLEAKGFILLHWGHAGWIHLFSKKPVRALDDLKNQKQWVWAGDNKMVQWWKQNGFKPVPLSVPDIPTGLQTGLIEAVPTTPLVAIGLQWFRSTPYMLDYAILPYLGATVVTKKTWDRISQEDRVAMRSAAKRAEEHLATEVPKQEKSAIEQMTQRGVTPTTPSTRGPKSDWGKAAAQFTKQMRERYESPELFDRIVELRDEFRARKKPGASAGD